MRVGAAADVEAAIWSAAVRVAADEGRAGGRQETARARRTRPEVLLVDAAVERARDKAQTREQGKARVVEEVGGI